MKKFTALLLVLSWVISINAQGPEKWPSGEIYQELHKLNFLGTVLYVAAHPDDENQSIISYFSNAVHANTGYLSLTRGDGGQNLIGPEIREKLGVIRTQELLAARSVDGGQQFFTRANDFGYSKHPDETFNIWNKDEVLSDVVWAIRKFQPDIIINRFDHRTPGSTHGHHTGSAMLSYEAFELTGKKDIYPEQLQYVEPWQPKRLFFNTGWWFYGSYENFEKADKSNMVELNVGTYFPILGKSNTEIAAEARSMHKCQGFGSSGRRGEISEYIELIKGEPLGSEGDPFQGINTTWSRVKGGEKIGLIIQGIIEDFDFADPSNSVPALIKAKSMIEKLEDDHWRKIKLEEIEQIIQQCLGLYALVSVNSSSAAPGDLVKGNIEVVNRSNIPVTLKNVIINSEVSKTDIDSTLTYNGSFSEEINIQIEKDAPIASPYWLNNDATLGMYHVEDQLLRGTPESAPSYETEFQFEIKGVDYTIKAPIVYKSNDPVKGEVFEPFVIIPAFSVQLLEESYLFTDDIGKDVNVVVKAGKNDVSGRLQLCHPNGWTVEPEYYDIEIANKGAETFYKFILTPPHEQEESMIVPMITTPDSVTYTDQVDVIRYDHIPTQTIVSDASVKVVKIDIKIKGKDIAYLEGAGDAIPASLEQIGYDVDIISLEEATVENLKNYDALIIGIRAYNTVDRIGFYQDNFMEYVKQGGTMIVQYNTSRGLNVEDLGPYPFTVSRDRVAVEDAEVKILLPEHEVMNYPNKITNKDFENWVQERGLYFPDEWDEKYDAILSSHDPGEDPKNGGLLVTQYGRGYYIYTGYSWFRELPAGVPGAYRIFANLVSIGKYDRP